MSMEKNAMVQPVEEDIRKDGNYGSINRVYEIGKEKEEKEQKTGE